MGRNKKRILDLKPTQFAVGMLEVDEKIKQVSEFSKKARKKYIEEHPVPVVVSPDGEYYVVDHHHFLCVCYHVGIEKVLIEIVDDLSAKKLTYADFWTWMGKNRSMYPFCQFGEGPREALYLPQDIRGLADDPYRSIAWFVRKSGAFENSEKNFAEFKWANFFRKHKLLEKVGRKGMPEALVEAVKLAQSPAARNLPGYGKLELGEKVEAIRKAKKKGQKTLAESTTT